MVKKIRKYLQLLLLFLLISLLLVSCGEGEKSLGDVIAENFSLFRDEIGEIIGFMNPDPASDAEFPSASPASPDTTVSPVIRQHFRTEVFESAYNDSRREATIKSLGEYAVYLGNPDDENADTSLYIRVEIPDNHSVDIISEILEEKGIEYDLEYRKNTSPAGDVFAAHYSGLRSEKSLYFVPGEKVILFVSDEKEAKKAEPGDERVIYLTFDDGPTAEGTGKILDTLDNYGINATFFTLGKGIDNYPDAARAICERGHNLACHSYSHEYKSLYASAWAFGLEIDEWENAIDKAGIQLSEGEKMFRFPGGSIGPYVDKEKRNDFLYVLEDRGYRTFDWNVATNDAVLYTSGDDEDSYSFIKETLISTLDTGIKQYLDSDVPLILLMHEAVPETERLLDWIIEYLIDEGFSFGNLRELDSWVFSGNE